MFWSLCQPPNSGLGVASRCLPGQGLWPGWWPSCAVTSDGIGHQWDTALGRWGGDTAAGGWRGEQHQAAAGHLQVPLPTERWLVLVCRPESGGSLRLGASRNSFPPSWGSSHLVGWGLGPVPPLSSGQGCDPCTVLP